MSTNHKIISDMAVFFSKRVMTSSAPCVPFTTIGSLIYLSDRLSLKTYGDSITLSDYVKLPSGPTLMPLVKMMSGLPCGIECLLKDMFYVTDVGIRLKDPSVSCFNYLSTADEEIMTQVWNTVSPFSEAALAALCADLPELKFAPLGAIPISSILTGIGYSPEEVKMLKEEYESRVQLDAIFSQS